MAETREAARRERLQVLQELDQMLKQRGIGIQQQAQPPKNGVETALPAASDLQLGQRGEGDCQHLSELLPRPANPMSMAAFDPNRTDQPHPRRLPLRLASLEPHTAAHMQPTTVKTLSARTQPGSDAVRALQPQPPEQDRIADTGPAVDAEYMHTEVREKSVTVFGACLDAPSSRMHSSLSLDETVD